MRKIESSMITAVHTKANWFKGSTAVQYNEYTYTSCIRLHGNIIATYGPMDAVVKPRLDTFREWPTVTTRSRLRALGVNASIEGGQAMIDGELI